MPKADIVTLKFHISENRNNQRDTFVSLLFNLLLSAFAFSGFGGVFCMTFNISINAPLVLFCACISSAFLLLPPKKLRIIGGFIPAASAIIINIFFIKTFLYSIIITNNREFLNTIYPSYYFNYSIGIVFILCKYLFLYSINIIYFNT